MGARNSGGKKLAKDIPGISGGDFQFFLAVFFRVTYRSGLRREVVTAWRFLINDKKHAPKKPDANLIFEIIITD